MDNAKYQGFKVMLVHLQKNDKSSHHLYMKPHKVRNSAPEKPTDRTLLIIGIPQYVNKDCLDILLSEYGEIENVFFQKKPSSGSPPDVNPSYFNSSCAVKGFKVAYVVFKDSEDVDNVMNADWSVSKLLSTKKHPIYTGLKKWCEEYTNRIPDIEKLNSEIERYLDEYDKQVEKEKQLEKEMEGVADSDGWIKVARSKHHSVTPRTETANKGITKKEKRRRQQTELMNFYAFQIRDTKMQHIAQLRKKFEEDKKRIEVMKASRKFRPY